MSGKDEEIEFEKMIKLVFEQKSSGKIYFVEPVEIKGGFMKAIQDYGIGKSAIKEDFTEKTQ